MGREKGWSIPPFFLPTLLPNLTTTSTSAMNPSFYGSTSHQDLVQLVPLLFPFFGSKEELWVPQHLLPIPLFRE